tara:strand:+ start:836 stop:1291 length:456 start_codon:yes stop_codon:yes gene_type:complete
MKLHNSIFFLLDNYYFNKYVEERKSLRSKSINFYISNTYKRSQSNKKFIHLRPIFNAICSLYFKRNVVFLKLDEMKELLDKIDAGYEITPRKYHLEEFYKEEPMTPSNYKSLCKYNFYDNLLFEYAAINNRIVIFKKIEKYNLELQKCQFI